MSSALNALMIAVQTRTPAMLWGRPGAGKSAMVKSLAEGLNEKMHTVLLGVREPQDQGGLPSIDRSGKKPCSYLLPPRWAAEIIQDGGGIVFFDEFSAADPQVQNSALRVVQEGYAGDEALPPATSFILAGNRASDNAGSHDLTAGMANRIVHLEIKLVAEEWRAGMIAGWPTPSIRTLGKDWQDLIPAKNGLVAAFIGIHPDHLDGFPSDSAAQSSAYASGRTWEYVAKLLAACESAGFGVRSEEARLLVKGLVGEGSAATFMSWIVNMDLPNPETILANPKKVAIPDRQDQIMALLDGVTAAALSTNHPEKMRIQRWNSAWSFIGRLIDDNKIDVCVPAARALAKQRPSQSVPNPPEAAKILPILQAANVGTARS